MLDTETDLRLRSGIHDTLASMLQTLAPGDLTHWLGLCRDVLSAAKNMKRQTAPEASAAKQAKGERPEASLLIGSLCAEALLFSHYPFTPKLEKYILPIFNL